MPGNRRWTREEEAVLGTETDRAIAVRIGRSKAAVLLRRQALGIAPAPTERRRSTKLTERQVTEIQRRYRAGGVTTTALGLEYRISPARIWHIINDVGRRRDRSQRIPLVEYDWRSVAHRLGREHDGAIARDLGCSVQAVRRQRVARGIEPYRR